MKLNEVKGEQAIEVMARMIAPIANLAADKDFMQLFQAKDAPDGQTPQEAALQRLTAAIPNLLVSHKQDFIELMAAVNVVSAEEYAETLTVPKLLHDVVELLTDRDLLGFFK